MPWLLLGFVLSFLMLGMSMSSHWTLGLSNETVKDNSNHSLLSPVFILSAMPACFSQWHREEAAARAELMAHTGAPSGPASERAASAGQELENSSLLALSACHGLLSSSDNGFICHPMWNLCQLKTIKNFLKQKRQFKQSFKMQTKVIW